MEETSVMMKLVVAVALLIGLITWRVVRKKKAKEALHRAQANVNRDDEEADDAVDAVSDETLSANARVREDGVAPAITTVTTGRASTNSPATTTAAAKKKKGGVLKGAAQLAMQGVKAVVPPYIIIDSGPRGY